MILTLSILIGLEGWIYEDRMAIYHLKTPKTNRKQFDISSSSMVSNFILKRGMKMNLENEIRENLFKLKDKPLPSFIVSV